jgi:hypothetical protein
MHTTANGLNINMKSYGQAVKHYLATELEKIY